MCEDGWLYGYAQWYRTVLCVPGLFFGLFLVLFCANMKEFVYMMMTWSLFWMDDFLMDCLIDLVCNMSFEIFSLVRIESRHAS